MTKIAHKIGLFTLVLTLLIVSAGLAGLNSVNELSNSLNYIRTTAWNAADGAMESTIELQSELLTTANIFSGAVTQQQGLKALNQSEINATEAVQRMISSGLMQSDRVDSLQRKIEQARDVRGGLLESFQQLNELEKKTGQTISQLDAMLMQTENTVEQNMDNNALINLTPPEIQELWDVADATMETRIGVLMASHASSQLMAGHDIERNQKTVRDGLAQAHNEISVLSKSALLQGMSFDGVNAGQAFLANFKQLQGLFENKLNTYFSYREQKLSMDKVTRELRDMLHEVEEEGDAKVESEMLSIDDAVGLAYKTVIGSIVIGILVAIGAFVASLRFIANPIENVATTLNNIADNGGDLTQSIQERGNDEITQLARGFNKFIAKTREIIEQVKLSSGQVSGQAGALENIIRLTSEGALNQKRHTEQVASGVTELVSTVSNVANHAKDAAGISQSANTSTSEGKELVRETVGKIQQLAQDMEQATNVIHKVQTEADNIGGVLDVIQGIAEQTNLLALNAAIEAARAGEQGRGFAVVADEVRTLASRTQESTTEIKAMIETLQTGSRDAVDVIARSHEQTGESAQSAQRADDALNRIVEAIKGILEANEQIATATNEQEVTSKLIGESAENIYGIAESTAHKAEEAMNSTHQLADRAVAMTELVSQFRT